MAKTRAEGGEEPDPFLVELGERVTKRRLAAGLNVEALAYRSELSNRSIVLIESANRNPSITTLRSLARGLDIDLYELIPGESELGQAEYAARSLKANLEAIMKLRPDLEEAIECLKGVASHYPALENLLKPSEKIDRMKPVNTKNPAYKRMGAAKSNKRS